MGTLNATKACPEFYSMKKIDWSRAHSQHTIACEADMNTQYLQQILGYHVKFKVCLVSKPPICALFSNFCKLREVSSVADYLKMCNKIIIELILCIILI